MICRFCNNKFPGDNIKYNCKNCYVYYYFLDSSNKFSFYEIHNKSNSYFFFFSLNKTNTCLYKIDGSRYFLISRFNNILDITPQNIDEQINRVLNLKVFL